MLLFERKVALKMVFRVLVGVGIQWRIPGMAI